MQAPFLIGDKIYLRPLERQDTALMRQWINDPEVTRTLSIYRPMNLSAEEAFVDHVSKSEHDLALGITLRAGDRLIGTTGLHQIDFKNRSASFGIEIGEKQEWGKGHGTEATLLITGYAFEKLNLNRVWLYVHEYNPAGVRAYEKVGYRREGVLRQHHFHDGRYWDTYLMAILREEWDERRRAAGAKTAQAAPATRRAPAAPPRGGASTPARGAAVKGRR